MFKIEAITARTILDSRGEQTVEARIKLNGGINAIASVPQGKSRGKGEAACVSASHAVFNIQNIISPALKGFSSTNQKVIDERMNHLDGAKSKENLGANSILSVSIAVARAAAISRKVPLWEHIRDMYGVSVSNKSRPRLFVNFINGGAHAKNKLAFQEYIAIIDGENFSEMNKTQELIWDNLKQTLSKQFGNEIPTGDEGGFAPNISGNLEPFRLIKEASQEFIKNGKVNLGTDVAGENAGLSKDERGILFETAIKDYQLLYIEDPYEEDDFGSFAKMRATFGAKIIIAGDDLTVTNPKMMNIASKNKSINGVIIKPNQIGSISEALEAVRTANSFNWKVIASHRSGETEDSFIADFAYAIGAFGLKLGVPTQSVRRTKYDRLMEIDKEI